MVYDTASRVRRCVSQGDIVVSVRLQRGNPIWYNINGSHSGSERPLGVTTLRGASPIMVSSTEPRPNLLTGPAFLSPIPAVMQHLTAVYGNAVIILNFNNVSKMI